MVVDQVVSMDHCMFRLINVHVHVNFMNETSHSKNISVTSHGIQFLIYASLK